METVKLEEFRKDWWKEFLGEYLRVNRKWWKESQIGDIMQYIINIKEKARKYLDNVLIEFNGNIYEPEIKYHDNLSVIMLNNIKKEDNSLLLVFNENVNYNPKPKSKRGLDELSFSEVYMYETLTLPLIKRARDHVLLKYKNYDSKFSLNEILSFTSRCYQIGILFCPIKLCRFNGELRFEYAQYGFRAKNNNGREHLLKELTDYLIENYNINISSKKFRKKVRELVTRL